MSKSGRPENWECAECEAVVDLTEYYGVPCPECGASGFLFDGVPK